MYRKGEARRLQGAQDKRLLLCCQLSASNSAELADNWYRGVGKLLLDESVSVVEKLHKGATMCLVLGLVGAWLGWCLAWLV